MSDMEKVLGTMKELYEEVVGAPAPVIGPSEYAPFPPGADPVRFAAREADEIARLVRASATAPNPVAWVPPVDAIATEDSLIVKLDVPGVKKDDLEVFVAANELVIRGVRHAPEIGDRARPLALEHPVGPFERRIPLPVGTEEDGIDAHCEDGVLRLAIAIEPEFLKEKKVRVA